MAPTRNGDTREMLYCYSTLDCFSTLINTILLGKRFGIFNCFTCRFDLRSTFMDAVPWSVQLLLTIVLLTGKILIFKDTG